ncbi:MAG: hypothetical protein HZC42_12020 [Candidatus Eisenbacteria bacterium]|nr:hypothetical protein [Candidatus Eisenbacteria bacterium]
MLAFVLVLALMPALAAGQSPPRPANPGRWTATKPWGATAVHLSLLRGDLTPHRRVHSQVLWWDEPTPSFQCGLWAWKPTTDDCASSLESNLTALSVPAPPRNIFCGAHTALADGNLFVVGGHENVTIGTTQALIFNRATRTWAVVDSMSQRRYYATATTLPDGRVLASSGTQYQHLVFFGGRTDGDTLRNSVDRFQLLSKGAWDLPVNPRQGQVGTSWPEKREEHSLASVPRGPGFVFGGMDASGRPLNDAWRLDRTDSDTAQTYAWAKLVVSGTVPARRLHAAVARTEITSHPAFPQVMYVFGGRGQTGPLGDLQRLRWESPWGWTWTDLTDMTQGAPPAPRYGHAAAYVDSLMVLCGGKDAGGQLADSLWVLSFRTSPPSWIRPTIISATRPSARYLHALANDSELRTRGGSEWDRFFLFGGRQAQEPDSLSNELWNLYLSRDGQSAAWFRLSPTGTTPAPRRQATIAYERNRVLIFGGDTGEAPDPVVWSACPDTEQYVPPSWVPLASSSLSLRGHTAFYDARDLVARVPETYNPVANHWSRLDGAPKLQALYPFTFVDTTGHRVFNAGPTSNGYQTYRLDLDAPGW